MLAGFVPQERMFDGLDVRYLFNNFLSEVLKVIPEQLTGLEKMAAKFKRYNPDFTGPDTPQDSIKAVCHVCR
ncbi:hypothetical protein DHEL01_v206688 [Diaporthe helianthi]|uniref:Uncharacterized protein n=1 Tax=Diaporthe helianthi TaxID=158607 RepID=A0A2P5HXE0_DIAHE|nr:hypothetical protein DHEL01_v206688 [Diaporthe helianthi]